MTPTTVVTGSGRCVDLVSPAANQVSIFDIAHNLAGLCRYSAACNRHFSVAEHSVWTSYVVDRQFAFLMLMHDAHEAYCGDATSPLKKAIGPSWDAVEIRLQRAVLHHYGLPAPDEHLVPWGHVHAADKAARHREILSLFEKRHHGLFLLHELPAPAPVFPGLDMECWSRDRAEREFLDRFFQLASEPSPDWLTRWRNAYCPAKLSGHKQSPLRHLAGAAAELNRRPFSPPPPAPPKG